MTRSRAAADKQHLTIKVAEVVFAFYSDRPTGSVGWKRSYRSFECDEHPDVRIFTHFDSLPELSLEDKHLVFDSQSLWRLFRHGGKTVFVLKSAAYDPSPDRVAVFAADFRHGDVYCRNSLHSAPPDGLLPDPFRYPLNEVLMVCLLAQSRGLMVHACGVDDGGRGYLFAGNSTHGKTTTARLWRNRATVLNDDRIVLRRREGRFWMYGTPWHGDYTGVAPHGVPLEKLFFLRHAGENCTRQVAGTEAASMLLSRCFPPLWDAAGMRFTVDFCAQLAESVPCYELGFLPDPDVVDCVRCVP